MVKYGLASLAQHIEDLYCTLDRSIAMPEYSVAVEHPGIIVAEEGLIILCSRESASHGSCAFIELIGLNTIPARLNLSVSSRSTLQNQPA